MQQKRFPLRFDLEYPPERAVRDVVQSVAEGERAGLLRAFVLRGYQEMQRERQRQENKGNTDGTTAT